MHSEDDQIVPIAGSAPLVAKLLKNGALKVYRGLPHGMPTTYPEIITEPAGLYSGLITLVPPSSNDWRGRSTGAPEA
jgi:hypothetical protein